jgi:two-component system NarL family sensor kinase
MSNKSIYSIVILFCLFSNSLLGQTPIKKKTEINTLIDNAIDYWYNDQYDLSLRKAKKALDQSIAIKDSNLIAESYNVIGVNFDDLVLLDKAMFYYKQGLKYAKGTNNSVLKSKLNNNIANIYFFEQKKYQLGLNYYQKALQYSEQTKDSVKIYLRKLNMTWAYFEINKFKEGKAYLDYINTHKKFGDESTLVLENMLNGLYYDKKQEVKKANYFYSKAIAFGKKGLEKFDLMITHEKFAAFLEKQKDYQGAYENLAQFNKLSNEILESEKVKKAKTTGLNVELNEYLREIKRVESDNKKKQKLLELETTMERRKLIALVSILLISIVLFYFYIQNSRLIQKNRLNGLRYKIQQNIVNATLSGQEMERKKIAYFLHDNISALLSTAGIHLNILQSKTEKNNEELTKTIAILNEAHDKVRDLSHELIPALLVRFGLFYAVEDVCEKNSNSKLQVEYESSVEKEKRFTDEFEIKIFFIVSELINNIIKHSNASMAKISIDQYGNQLSIKVFDNGKGFDIRKFNNLEGFGINQIKSRINGMKGKINIDSKLDMGTIITIDVPIQ